MITQQKLPNVVFVGMGKSGSTLLYKMCLRHPDIFVCDEFKELNYFGNFARWTQGNDWYTSKFEKQSTEKFIIDISPGYHIKEITRKRMLDTLGSDIKIIFSLRQFTDFAYSRYLQKVRSRMKIRSFLYELEELENFYRPLDQILEYYLTTYGEENVLILEYEKDFVFPTYQFEQKFYNFLGLSDARSYYNHDADAGVNTGYAPRFLWTGDSHYEEINGDRIYKVPRQHLLFCNGRTYKNIHWINPSKNLIEELKGYEAEWDVSMKTELYSYVQERYTLPLAEKIQGRVGINLDYWNVPPKEKKYPIAPLSDAWLVSASNDYKYEETPWG